VSYRIKTVEQLTGLSRNTITAWERRYDLLEPRKDPSGYRSYTDGDVELLLRVKGLLDRGFQIGEVAARMRAERTTIPDAAVPSIGALGELRRSLLDRLLGFDRSGADDLLERLLEVSFRRRVDQVYMPVLHDLGDRWEEGTCSVAQEHFVSAFVREQLVTMLKSLEVGPRDGPRAVCACYPGELHELGLLAIAIHLALSGHRVVYLGADLPTDQLAVAVQARPAELVCVSVIMATPASEVLAVARDLRSQVDPRTVVAYGGPPVLALVDRSADGLLFCPRWEDLRGHLDEVRARRLLRAG
jgi:MerR family transcriptional regulator, light-induced transcriptional regulator